MSSTPIADTVRSLEETSVAMQKHLHAIAAEHEHQVGQVINRVANANPSSQLPQILHNYRRRVSSIIVDELAVEVRDITMRRATTLKVELLLSPPPDVGFAHLETLSVAGEPNLPTGTRYVDVSDRPLAPEVLGAETVRQGTLGDWWLIAAICAVAHWDPQLLRDMVTREGDVITVTVANGTYQFPATLPVNDADGNDSYAWSSDGSILVPSLEKAVAEHFGAYRHLNTGSPAAALQWLVGGTGRTDPSSDFDDDRLVEMLADRQPMVAHNESMSGTHDVQRLAAEHDVVLAADQAYVMTGLDGEGQLKLYNPRGLAQPKPMDLETFRTILTVVSWRDPEEPPMDEEASEDDGPELSTGDAS